MVRKTRGGRKGFTLVELMTVVIIVGILAVISVPLYRAQVDKARAAEGAALLGSVLTAEKVYYAEYKSYTDDQDELGVDTTGNKYFKAYDVTDKADDSFKAETIGTGVASTIKVRMEYTNGGGAELYYDYNYEE